MEEAIESWPKKKWDIPKVTQILANLEYGPLFLSPNTIFMLLNYYFTRIKELDFILELMPVHPLSILIFWE